MRRLAPVSSFRNRPIVVITLRVMNPVKHHAERDDYFLLSQPPSEGGRFHDGNAPAGAVAAALRLPAAVHRLEADAT